MPSLAEAWTNALPEIRNGVTGVGVWTALNTARPVLIESGTLVIGLPYGSTDLAGHLRMAHVKSLIEQGMTGHLGEKLELRVIEGTAIEDWETVKRRDVEAKRLQDQAMARTRAEIQAKSSWDSVYEQITRKYASIPNKSLPQNRAQFVYEAIELLTDARRSEENSDDLDERSFARCIERVSQYSELPSAYVAMLVLDKLKS